MKTVPPNSPVVADAVREFVATERSIPLDRVTLEKGLFHDLGIDGDDAFDLINRFSIRFNVSLEGICFQKYFEPEGASGPIAFLSELLWKNKSTELLRIEIGDLVTATTDGKFPDASSAQRDRRMEHVVRAHGAGDRYPFAQAHVSNSVAVT